MDSLNTIMIEGNVTREPESKNTTKGTAICSFSVASNRFFRLGESLQKEVSFFDIETWSGMAERCASDLHKGRGVRIIGRLKQDRWIDTDGKSHSKVKIVAESVEFKPISTKKEELENEHSPAMSMQY